MRIGAALGAWSVLAAAAWTSGEGVAHGWAVPIADPAPRDPADDAWQLGSARPLRAVPLERKALCDFARLAAQQQALPLADDPVFRSPSAEAKAALGKVRKALMAGEPQAAQQLGALLAGAEGPALARLALQDRDARVQTAAAQASVALAATHPRLFAFVPVIDAKTPPPLAMALLRMDFATGCDTPVLYALDALDHPAAEVVELALRLAIDQAGQVRSAAPINRVAAWLERRSGPARLRQLAARLVGALGLLHLSAAWERLSRDPDPLVAGEARVAWARVAPSLAAKQLATWGGDPRPCSQIATLRAIAEVGAEQPAPWLGRVRTALTVKARCRDALSGAEVSVAAVAGQVLDFWEVLPAPQR